MATETTLGTHVEEGTYLTAAETAQVLDRNPKRITQLIQGGKLPCVRVGPHALILREAVLERKRRQEEWERQQAEKQHAAEQG